MKEQVDSIKSNMRQLIAIYKNNFPVFISGIERKLDLLEMKSLYVENLMYFRKFQKLKLKLKLKLKRKMLLYIEENESDSESDEEKEEVEEKEEKEEVEEESDNETKDENGNQEYIIVNRNKGGVFSELINEGCAIMEDSPNEPLELAEVVEKMVVLPTNIYYNEDKSLDEKKKNIRGASWSTIKNVGFLKTTDRTTKGLLYWKVDGTVYVQLNM